MITQSEAVRLVENSNHLAEIKARLRGGEHKVFFSNIGEADIEGMSGYTVNAVINNSARTDTGGREVIERFFVSKAGDLYVDDALRGMYLVD